MIVRINQFDASQAEPLSRWEPRGLGGPIEYAWPDGAHGFELVILNADERHQALEAGFRREQLRQLIPEVAAALSDEERRIALRLDGPMAEGELAGIFGHLAHFGASARFAVSDIQRFDLAGPMPPASVRLAAPLEAMTALCVDPRIGLDRSVRLRAFDVPEDLVNPLLDIGETDDERWEEILSQAGFMLSTMRGLESLYILTNRFDPEETRRRLMRRLAGQ